MPNHRLLVELRIASWYTEIPKDNSYLTNVRQIYRQIIINFSVVEVTSVWGSMFGKDATSFHEILNETDLYFTFLI